jgi:hypothetical protein
MPHIKLMFSFVEAVMIRNSFFVLVLAMQAWARGRARAVRAAAFDIDNWSAQAIVAAIEERRLRDA